MKIKRKKISRLIIGIMSFSVATLWGFLVLMDLLERPSVLDRDFFQIFLSPLFILPLPWEKYEVWWPIISIPYVLFIFWLTTTGLYFLFVWLEHQRSSREKFIV